MASKDNLIAFHYFRLSAQTWPLMLARVRQLGAETVHTPVPWGFHEFAENRFDFSGVTNPRRDVIRFVDLAIAMGLGVSLDLAPTLAAELNLLHHGLPGWLLKNYPEVRAKNAQNEALSRLTLEHPTALKLVERWLDQVSSALLDRHQNPETPVAARINLAAASAEEMDYNSHVIEVQWPVWLRKRYAEGGIEALNAAYQAATPYSSFSKVPLTGSLEAAAFKQDRHEFLTAVTQQAQQTYAALLTGRGWSLSDPLEPPHGFQVNPDPLEIGASFRWAMAAPLRPAGTPRPNFWTIKQEAMAALPAPENLIYRLPGAARIIRLSQTDITCYRLLLNGRLLATALDLHDGRSILTYHSFDNLGQTDLYFTLPDLNTPLSGYLSGYLRSLLAGQRQSLLYGRALAEQLAAALQPAPPAVTTGPATAATLVEAERGLDEALLALQKATASIGALEQAFAIALDKPEVVMARPLLGIDGAQLGPVRAAFEAVSTHLAAAIPADPGANFTAAQYQAAYDQAVAAAEQAIALLDQALRWLRQGLADQSLPPAARFVHSYVETLLQSLSEGGLRAD